MTAPILMAAFPPDLWPNPTITLPPIIPVIQPTADEILTGNRTTSIRYDLLTRTDVPKGNLDGVDEDSPGELDWVASAAVKGGGRLDLVDNGQSVDFLNDRIRPVVAIDGLEPEPLGVFLFSEAPADWSDTGHSWAVGLLDKTTILDQDKVESTYAVDAGAVITDAVATLVASTGETNYAITPSAATLANALVWEAGTTKLRIVNDLLSAVNYFAVYCDSSGQFRAEPYVRPAARPIVYEFVDGANCIYLADFRVDVDLFSIPNKVVVTSQGSGDTAGLTSTATNEDPLSPYSFPSRGRWIVHSETGVEIADQATLDAYARRRLIELTSPTSTIEIQHAYIPGLAVNQAVRFRRTVAGIDARHVVAKTVVSLDPTALATTTLTEVVDL